MNSSYYKLVFIKINSLGNTCGMQNVKNTSKYINNESTVGRSISTLQQQSQVCRTQNTYQ